MYFCVVLCTVCFVSFSVLFVCICVLNYCHRVATQLQLNICIIFQENNRTGNVCINVTLGHVRETIVAVEKQELLSTPSLGMQL